MLKSKSKPEERTLILTSSGGIGHLHAAKAKEQEIKAKAPDSFVCVKDIFVDFLGRPIGSFFTSLWNRAKMHSNLSALKSLIRLQPLADKFLYFPIIYQLKNLVLKHKITRIIDTQNMGLAPILKVLEALNKNRDTPISYSKILTDLPTENSIHYFRPIKKIPLSKKQNLQIVSTKPLLVDGMSEESFWMHTCGLFLHNITYDSFPLRKAFHPTKEAYFNKSLSITLNMHSIKLCNLICDTLSFGSIHFVQKKQHLDIHIAKDIKLTLIMLGGYPNEEALLCYIKQFMLQVKEQKHLVCLFCNFGLNNSTTLIKKIYTLITNSSQHPKNLSILPMPYQEDSVIMPLLSRANGAISRAGGITSMELLTSFSGLLWIHLESTSNRNSTYCMPIWERGNAQYLQAKLGAEFITPQSFIQKTQGYFS